MVPWTFWSDGTRRFLVKAILNLCGVLCLKWRCGLVKVFDRYKRNESALDGLLTA